MVRPIQAAAVGANLGRRIAIAPCPGDPYTEVVEKSATRLEPITTHFLIATICALLTVALFPRLAIAQQNRPVHGLWVWKTTTVLAAPGSADELRDFCQREHVSEVYVSFSRKGSAEDREEDTILANMIRTLRKANVRVEALLSSTDADEPGKHRDKLLEHIREVEEFNRSHRNEAFDGVHLDVEPQQRPENKGPGNLRFLPDLVETYRQARQTAESGGLTINADIQNKLLKGDLEQRRSLLRALPRLTLMLYELSSPNDGQSEKQKEEKLRSESEKFMQMAYEGLDGPGLAKLEIGLRTPDYEQLMPSMLKTIDAAMQGNPHYLGWSWHSWNDQRQ
jgi:hypothetical protein